MPASRPSPDSPDSPRFAPASERRVRIWRRNLAFIAGLLAVWAALSFLPTYFAGRLSFNFIGWPFSFWMAAYGAPLAYLLIIVFYARVMNRDDPDERGD